MKKLVLGLFALVMTLAFCAAPASAASSKKKKETKKKEEKKKEEKKETKKSESHSTGSKHYLSGTNTMGRSGLFFADDSEVAGVGKIEGSAHLTYSSPASGFNNLSIPFGAHFGIAENFELSAAGVLGIFDTPSFTFGPITIPGSSASSFGIDLGGKYKLHLKGEGAKPEISLGGDVLIPTNGGSAVATPRGTVSYTLSQSGLYLNGDLGVHISTATYVSFDAGAGYPFSNNLTGIVEIGANQSGNGGSLLAGGVRAGADHFKFQGFLGIPLNGGGVLLGGGIIVAN